MTIQDLSASTNPSIAGHSAEETDRFNLFVREHYPFHHRRLISARSAVRFAMLKGSFWTSVFFGLPIAGTIWAITLVVQANAASLMDTANPIPFIEGLEPAGRAAVVVVFTICVILGAISGYLKQQRLSLQIEKDELGLRTEFLLRESFSKDTGSRMDAGNYAESDEHRTIVRNPKREPTFFEASPNETTTDFVSTASNNGQSRTGNLNQSRV